MGILLKNLINFSKSNKNYFCIILFVFVLIICSLFLYFYYFKDYLTENYTPNKEFISQNSNENKNADIYFFFTEWCPHCKTAKPIWNQFKEQNKNKELNNVNLNFIEIDCDKDTETANKFDVEGYPTIKMVYNNKIIEYDAKPEIDTLNEFVNKSLLN